MENRVDLNKKSVLPLSAVQVLEQLDSRAEGISSDEANTRRKLYGANTFKTSKKSALAILVRQFQNAIIYLLIAAAVASFLTGDYLDGGVVSAILLINALLGFTQEYRSEQALEELTRLVKHHVIVKREGKNTTSEHDGLVPGDVVILKEGDIVPADCKILQADGFIVDESALTGESVPVNKSADAAARNPDATLVFAGSVVQKGEGVAVVYATGEVTELGQIAHLSIATQKVTQYGKSLESFSYLLMKIVLLLIPPIFLVKIFLLHGNASFSDNLVFMFSFAIAVAPEALPVIVTVTLASGALKLAKRHVVVRELSAMEDLGNITLLCTDKTGTLTENKMTVSEVIAEKPEWVAALAYASIEKSDRRHRKYADPYDLAIEQHASKESKAQAADLRRVKELPFDPEARRRWVLLQNMKDHKRYIVQLGSAETLLKESTNGKDDYAAIMQADGKKGLRDFGITCKEVDADKDLDPRKNSDQSEFVGFFKMLDPLRPSTKHTIHLAQEMGLGIKILTGDSREVAGYVAEQIGLLKPGERVYIGEEIEQMSERELKNILPTTHVFAKVSPVQKYNLIKLLKENDVVGYQGDGINDAPSLKLADVAIAVDTATDVAKEEADILLLRPDLEVIVRGIRYGRAIFANINKYIRYTMIGNFSQFFTLAVLFLAGTDLPLLPRQVLIISTFTQIPLVAIASDNVSARELSRPSRYNIRSLMIISLVLGIVTAIYQLLYFVFFIAQESRTETFNQTSLTLFLAFVQLIVIFSVRGRTFFWKLVKPSASLIAALAAAGILILAMTYWDVLKNVMGFETLPLTYLLSVGFLLVVYLLLIDVGKVWYYRLAPWQKKSGA